MSDQPELPRALCFVCRCEEVSDERLALEIERGCMTLNDLKRRTRAAMGPCQGAYCLPEMARTLANATGQAISDLSPMTYRPPARAVIVDALARSVD